MPDPIQIDKIVSGAATLRCRWNISEISIDDGWVDPHTEWEYNEHVMVWALDDPDYITVDSNGRQHLSESGHSYFIDNKDAILKWAMAAGK